MPELAGNDVGVGVAEEAGQQGQVIVLNEDGGGASVYFLNDLLGKGAVDGGVGFPVGLLEGGFDEGVVTQGPQPLVGNAVVVALLLLGGQPYETEGVGGVVGGDHYAVLVVHCQVVAGAAAVGDPSSSALLHQGVNSGGDAAGRDTDAQLAVNQLVNVGLTVGNDDNPVVANLPVDQTAQPVSGPDGLSHLLPLLPPAFPLAPGEGQVGASPRSCLIGFWHTEVERSNRAGGGDRRGLAVAGLPGPIFSFFPLISAHFRLFGRFRAGCRFRGGETAWEYLPPKKASHSVPFRNIFALRPNCGRVAQPRSLRGAGLFPADEGLPSPFPVWRAQPARHWQRYLQQMLGMRYRAWQGGSVSKLGCQGA